MARDRVVRWQEEVPKQDDLEAMLEKFFSGLATSVKWDRDRFFVMLHGAQSFCFRNARIFESDSPTRERWIEVWPSDDDVCCYVMTRMQDEVTNVLADGFAGLIARTWQGKLDPT